MCGGSMCPYIPMHWLTARIHIFSDSSSPTPPAPPPPLLLLLPVLPLALTAGVLPTDTVEGRRWETAATNTIHRGACQYPRHLRWFTLGIALAACVCVR